MNSRRATSAILGALLLAMLTGGCVASRQRYFEELHHRRSLAYGRWQKQSLEDERPRIEGELSLQDAVRLALEYNTELQAALQEKEIARGGVCEAYSEILPRVDLSAGYTRLDEVFTVDLGTESFPVGDLDNYSCQVTVTQPLFKGGKMFIARRAARLSSYLADEEIRRTVEDVIFATAKGYYEAVLAERLVQVQEAALESARAQLGAVTARKRQGVATEYDVLRARVEVALLEADLIEQKNRRDQTLASLLNTMGVSQQSQVEPTTELSFQPGAPSFQEAVRSAFENRPDIYLSSIDLDLQRESLNDAYTSYLPRLEAYYWNQWAKPDPHEGSRIHWGSQWQAGLTLTWPLFDGLAREGRIIREKALLRQKEVLLSGAEERAILEVRSALLELENAEKFVESQQQNLERADRALQLVQAGYREGVNTEVEVLDATAALTRARGLYYKALHRHTIARVTLQRAMGMLGPPPGTARVPKQVAEPGCVWLPDKENKPDEP